MNNIKTQIDKLYKNDPNNINYGQIQLIVMGESEGSTIYDKTLVAITVLNRINSPKYNFNSLKEDFHGYKRNITITNNLERKQFEDSVRTIIIAKQLIKINPSLRNIYFFNNHGGKPSSFFDLELVDIDRQLIDHYFFRITNKL